MKKLEGNILPLTYLLIFSLFYLLFYPEIYSFEDESSYFGMGYILSQGSLYPDLTNTHIIHTYFNGEHMVTKHPLGISILIAPFFLIDYRFVFFIPFALFVAGYLFFIKLLKRNSLPLFLSFLYLFFPPFVIYSRTLMADLPGAIFVLISYYYFSNNKKSDDFLCGLFAGFAVLFKYPNILFIFGISIFIFYKFIIEKSNRRIMFRKLLVISAGAIPSAIIIGLINYYLYNGVFNLPDNVGYFSINHLIPHFGKYLFSLSTVYPFMILSVLFVRKKEYILIILSAILYLLFYSPYYFIQGVGNFYTDIIISQRFLLPVSLLLLLPYSGFVYKILSFFQRKIRIVLILIALLSLTLVSFFINFRHQKFLEAQLFFRDKIYAETDSQTFILIDETTVELLQDVWGKRDFLVFDYHGDLAVNLDNLYLYNYNKYSIIFRKRMSNERYIEELATRLTDFYEKRCILKEDKKYAYSSDKTSTLFIIKFKDCLN